MEGSGPSGSMRSQSTTTPGRRPFVPPHRRTGSSQPDVPPRRITNLRWNDQMDHILVERLHKEVLSGPRRADNGFTNTILQTVVDKVRISCGVIVQVNNVRARLKTLRKEYLEVRELLQLSGFGIDPVTRKATAEPEVWEAYLEGKKDPHKIRGRTCKYYEELAVIYGNDTATGLDVVSGDDFEGIPVDTLSGQSFRNQEPCVILDDEEIGTNNADDLPQFDPAPTSNQPSASNSSGRSSRKRSLSAMNAEVEAAMSSAIESIGVFGKKIAAALEGTNWTLVERRLWEIPGIYTDDLLTMIDLFEKDEKLARIFLGLSARAKESWVLRKLGRRPVTVDDIDFYT